MKKIALVGTALALAMVAGTASAANSMNAGTLGLNVSVVPSTITIGTLLSLPSPLINGKYFVAKDMAILGGFGFNTGGPSGNTTTSFAFEVGARKYMSVNDFAPFIGGGLLYGSSASTPAASVANPAPTSATTTLLQLQAQAGAEYFVGKQFSFEGTAGFGFQQVSSGGTSANFIGTSTLGLSANVYF